MAYFHAPNSPVQAYDEHGNRVTEEFINDANVTMDQVKEKIEVFC
jgi:hypothetical protein